MDENQRVDPDAEADPNPRCPECNGELQLVDDGPAFGQWMQCEDCSYAHRGEYSGA